MALGCLAGETGEFGCLVGDSRGDAAPVEPVGAFHYSIEVEVLGVCFGDGRAGAVVDNLGRAHRCAGLAVIYAHAVAAAGNVVGVYTIAAQGVERGLTDLVLGKFRYEECIVAIVGAAYSYVGLAAAPDDVEVVDLDEAMASCG